MQLGMRSTVVCTLALWVSLQGLLGAEAHVGSDEKTNNRYYKLSPMADRLRVVYTIFFGRQPGNALRRQMDRDRDRNISESEKHAWKEEMADAVMASVQVEQGGRAAVIHWSEVSLGMAGDGLKDGPFSLDLVGSVCLTAPSDSGEHSFVFRESLRLPKPGETELHLDPAPGTIITKQELSGREIEGSDTRWQGGAGPVASGFRLQYRVAKGQTAALDSLCDPPAAKDTRGRSLLAIVGALLLAGLGIWFVKRRQVC